MLYPGFDDDRDYLVNKFRHPELDPATGLDNAALKTAILQLADELEGQPHAVVKARAFALVCEKMQIDVDPHDDFPAFACYDRNDRPLRVLMDRWNAEFDRKFLPDVQPEIDARNKAGIHRMWKDFDHSVPDWDAVFELGFPGLRERARQYRAKHEKNGTLTPAVAAHFDGIEITYTAILDCLGRFIDFARSRHAGNLRIEREIRCLEQLRTGAPRDTYEHLQTIYLYFMFSEHIDHLQVRSLGNLDRELMPIFERDLREKRYTMDEMRELWSCFFMQWGSIDNYWGQPMYLGGTKVDGTTEYNDLSYFILEIMDLLAIPTPKTQLKIARNTPQKLLDTACDMIRRGHSSIVFVGEEPIRRVMMGLGFDEEIARTCDIRGCYEFSARARGNGTGVGHVNFLKSIELLFNDGVDPSTGYKVECGAPKLADIRSFGEFYRAYFKYVGEATEQVYRLGIEAEKELEYINPAPVFSATIAHSMELGVDAFARGMEFNNGGILGVGFGSAADCLAAVKELVYEKKELTLTELRDILRANWAGHEDLQERMRRSRRKYGNGVAEVDEYARAIAHFFGTKINLRPNKRGGFVTASGHCAKQYFDMGEHTGATPDGRSAGEEMSKNLTPAPGADRSGVTALIRSVCTIDSADLPGDFPLDVMMHPSSVQGADGLAAWRKLIRVYFAGNGVAIHFNIFDAAVLEDAQKHPENYAGLQVRVCGWNVHFVEMWKVEQDAFIRRAKNIAE